MKLIVGMLILVLLAVAGCNGIDLGMNPGPDVRKEQGPLTRPPRDVLRGTAL